ncbi:MAG: ATP-binding protein [Bacteroidales bacterium]|jgi:predicted AAA+ superfamily ATPase|nr:ATP-binding protein [Bacteroidales bacterium]
MEKDLTKQLILEYQEIALNKQLFVRPFNIEDNLNYVFVGLRRAGKSFLMFQQIQKMIKNGHSKDEILYFNFEDDRLGVLNISDLEQIKLCYEELFDSKPIFFLDEIQIVQGWEKFARRLADTGYRVFITGSNAKMLSKEIATTLGGRFMITEVFPLSFKEFLHFNNIDLSNKNAKHKYRNEIIKFSEKYFYFGGLPEVVNIADKREWISNLYQKIFYGDLIARHQIRNDFALKILIKKLAENIKQPSSYNRIANIVSASGKKITTDTVIDYMEYLKESLLIFAIENISAKFQERESNRKYYFIDNGLLNLFLIDPNTFLLENIVAIQLLKKYKKELYFYNKNIEVDFYIPDEKLAIQVSYSMSDLDTRKREVDALDKLSGKFDLENMSIITKDEEETIITNSGKTIEVIPLWKWLFAL